MLTTSRQLGDGDMKEFVILSGIIQYLLFNFYKRFDTITSYSVAT